MHNIYHLADIIGEPLTENELQERFAANPDAYEILQGMKKAYYDKLMDFLLGKRGLAVTYDFSFKRVMNPEANPERMESFLSAIIGMKVRIRKVLPVEGIRMAETGGNVIMDIRVELEDGRIVDVEIQKVGYKFPGERCDCYVSDMIMRQYNYEKKRRKKKFTYQDMNPVILIVIMEESSPEFHRVKPCYVHRGTRRFDTGVKVRSLSEIVLISLDIFHDIVQTVDTDLEAWLTFLSEDDPEKILNLVNRHPEFLQCYKELAVFRKNPEELVGMYSAALAEMDRNILQASYEDIYNMKVEKLNEKIADKEAELADKNAELADKKAELADKEAEIADKEAEIADKEAELADKKAEIADKEAEIADKEAEIADKEAEIADKDAEIARLTALLATHYK